MKILTFGCFSIVHAGHFDLFKQSKELCPDGRLIVAIAADKVVRAAKGTNAPIYSLRERMSMISGCRYVDEITIYGQEIPDTNLKNTNSYEEVCQLVQECERRVVSIYTPDIVTFGEDKPHKFYAHLKGVTQYIQLPRLGGEITSTDIRNKIQTSAAWTDPTLPDNYDETV